MWEEERKLLLTRHPNTAIVHYACDNIICVVMHIVEAFLFL